ncbi:Lipoprotein OS=Streptomyces alboniger OX=132473 GN=CP975_14290 PE=4 SV=1 [Streptomyces alboniger]
MRHHSRLRRTAVSAACVAVAATVGLTACGTESGTAGPAGQAARKNTEEPKGPFAGMSGGEIAEKAVEATSKAESLRIKGDVTDGEEGSISLDMALDTGGRCAGTMGMGGQGSIELIIPGGTVYLKYDEKFLRAQSKGEPAADVQAAVDMLAGRWAKTGATSADAKEFGAFCDLDVVLADFKDARSAARRGGTTTVDGVPAIRLTESDGKEKYELYVATKGKPYLLKVDTWDGGKPQSLTFGDFDKPVRTTPPTGDVLDLDKLAG